MEDEDDSKGAYNREHIFKGETYAYWKDNMYVHLLSVDKNLWVAVTDDPLCPKGGGDFVKHPKDWIDNETKQASYDLKVRNILITLSAKVLYSILHHKSAKGMWDALQTLYEGTDDAKDSKINMLAEEFELFCMEPREFVDSIQTRFLHLINKLSNLGKTFSNKDYANKIVRYMCRE